MNQILYKFQDWDNVYHRKSVINGEVYFSNNFSFNDPFDLQLPLIAESELKFDMESFMGTIKQDGSIDPKQIDYQTAKEMWEKISKENPEIRQKGIEKMRQSAANIENNLGVLCLSKSNESTLMWGHYANSHKGYCIGFDRQLLLQYLISRFHQSLQLIDVNYSDKIPKLDFKRLKEEYYLDDFVNKRFSTKHIDWKYENEVRFVAKKQANQLLNIPKEIYREMIFGYKIDKTNEKEIKVLCKHLYPNMKYYKAEPNKNEFKMEIREVELNI